MHIHPAHEGSNPGLCRMARAKAVHDAKQTPAPALELSDLPGIGDRFTLPGHATQDQVRIAVRAARYARYGPDYQRAVASALQELGARLRQHPTAQEAGKDRAVIAYLTDRLAGVVEYQYTRNTVQA